MAAVPNLTLNNGQTIPALGLGTWKSPKDEVYDAVKYAIKKAGYRHIDCALIYQNEEKVGRALKEVIEEKVVTRDQLFITSKVWNTYHSKEKVAECLNLSLNALGLDYLDLYLIHWPMGYKEGGELFPEEYSDVDYIETWKAMEQLVKDKKVKSIGVSNFNEKQINRILEICEIKPVINQVECHPYLIQTNLQKFCAEKGILLTAYSPLGTPDRPWARNEEPFLLNDLVVNSIAKKYNKYPAQILIKFQLQRNIVVIPKSVTPQRISDNIDVFNFELTEDDMASLLKLNKDYRFCALPDKSTHQHYPF